MRANSLNHFKSVLVFKFFVAPADRNYYLARWTRIHGFKQEFYWQSLQAIEKYLKASLAANNISTLKDGHDLLSLLTKHQNFFQDLALQSFVKPERLSEDRWDPESVMKFVKRIGNMGCPDSRYGLVSWYHTPNDLFKLDQLVFHLRRLSIGLDWQPGQDWELDEDLQTAGLTCGELLRKQKNYQTWSPIQIPDMSTSTAGSTLLDTLHAWNFELARSGEDICKPAPNTVSPAFGPMENSYIFLLWEYLQGKSWNDDPYVLAGIEWLIKTVFLSGTVKNAFANRIQEIQNSSA